MTYLSTFRRTLLAITLFVAGGLTINAQTTSSAGDIPRTISYQGVLSTSDGASLPDGRYLLTVALFADPNGSQRVWQDSYTTQVTGGLFNLSLGDGNPLPDAITMNAPLWIGTSIDGGDVMRPLTPLSASPYALNVSNESITTDKLVDGAVTAAKVDMDYISEIRIDGEKISAKGSVLNLLSTSSVPLKYDEATQSLTIGRTTSSAQAGDREKEASILAGTQHVWSVNGDGWDAISSTPYSPGSGDWLGTSNAVDLLIKVNGVQTMLYQQTGAFSTPNIIGGAATNSITNATASIIAAGESNTIDDGTYNVIGGGSANSLTNQFYNDYNTIAGGEENSVDDGQHNSIGGGFSNRVEGGRMNVIGGGDDNYIFPPIPSERINWATIGGGEANVITGGVWGTIGGGFENLVTAGYGVVGGGQNNIVSTNAGTIAGGRENTLIACTDYSFIGGGMLNDITSTEGVIGGGYDNQVRAMRGALGGGALNDVTVFAFYGTIGGGEHNVLGGSHSVIGGGDNNMTIGSHTTIPGGDWLRTSDSYGQTAVGFINDPRGTVPDRPNTLTDDPLFMVGNGNYNGGNLIRSNAFEVSYNGHSVVYDENGTGAGRTPIRGATYTDNILYAWGDIAAGGGINSDFGVTSVVSGPPGVYTVTINMVDPLGNPIVLNNASITATIVDNTGSYGCTSISTSQIGFPGPNQFTVRTYRGLDCGLDALPFTFKVCGRP